MSLQYHGFSSINGSLVALENVENVGFEEMVEITLQDGSKRQGRVVEIQGDKVILQVFEGTSELSTTNAKTRFTGHPMEIALSEEVLGRIFNGVGNPLDGLGSVYAEKKMNVNGNAINPVCRQYPRNYINTGISAIDGLNTLIRGQKLPIFTGSGLPHNELAVQIVKNANISDEDSQFVIVFAAMGVKHDVADYFKQSFIEAGVMDRVVMYLNLSNDPIIERILTPRCALTCAEYLAYEKGMQVLVIMTDMTSYCEALREFSSSKEEIPGRKGYPGYLYSDLASLYERAGMIKGSKGSITQIPILTMPNFDVTHPVPDLTGYITEGQIVLDEGLNQMGLYPPINVLPSLSRLMKDGIGEGYTRKDHSAVSSQLFASYAKVQDARSLASVIGEEELSTTDRFYMAFGRLFEQVFVAQGFEANRSINETLDLGWNLLSLLPISELDRVNPKVLEQFYNREKAISYFKECPGVTLDTILTESYE
ncbi:MAG: V-type ATP synthase subunit B [Erysipelotrichaceae bacterium]|nr:V-type ATP synthase subunit B [Erysipelotrichaceae bacterium]